MAQSFPTHLALSRSPEGFTPPVVTILLAPGRGNKVGWCSVWCASLGSSTQSVVQPTWTNWTLKLLHSLVVFLYPLSLYVEKQKSLNVSGVILPPRVTVGQKGRVTVSIEGRRVDRVQTAWFLNDTPISDTSHNASEKGRLLPSRGEMGYYKMHTLGPLHSSGSATQQLISSLTFIPQISIHKGAVFKCQVSYMGKDKIVVERVSEKFTILFSVNCRRVNWKREVPKCGSVFTT
ncbi:unnamed protein product [Tetraodon nigroviridis]|uniref:(spotted green pufferfish) hypothetical protein n=1 Tax=Tetraodon nigroviridis TaxID=99883 RepID=Q4RVI7_TETNG|nr:unnamed protein product [Tetraodon nigroviridis]